jgi:Domain of unknown function (DUF4153)
MNEADGQSDGGWRLRPAILAALGLVAAIVVQQLGDPDRTSYVGYQQLPMWRIALALAAGTGAVAFGFALERVRILWTIGFALLIALVTGGIYYECGGGNGWNWFGDWRYGSLFLAIAIAVPLFQTARDEGVWRFPYADVHGHAWTNVVLWFACWIFTGVVLGLLWLLASLFDLIGMHFLSRLLNHGWFYAGLIGAAFGGGLGLLRERDRVVRLLQRVVTAVLAVLAPVLAVGLVVFLVSLPFTGLAALWDATKSATPILLSCVIGALILANAVIGNGADEEIGNPVLRWSALALAVAALPLCIIAAVAIGLRIGQYGFTPDRLWAWAFVVLATVYGVAYLGALVIGRRGWAAQVRATNLHMAFIVAGVSLILATPLVSFNAMATRDQVARLERGRIGPDKFDWAALAFDFGAPGKAALAKLAHSADAKIAATAKDAAGKENRWQAAALTRVVSDVAALPARLHVVPAAVPVPAGLMALLTNYQACGSDRKARCLLLYSPGAGEAIAMLESCVDDDRMEESSRGSMDMITNCEEARYRLNGDKWALVDETTRRPLDATQRAALKAGVAGNKVEIRTVPSRQLFIGGVPVGQPFE